MIEKAVKKPVVIEFIQFIDDESALKILEWIGGGKVYLGRKYNDDHCVYIKTLEGEMRADIGDYVVKGVSGEFYPVKPDIFLQTYDVI